METKKILIADHIALHPMYIMLKNPVHTTKVLNDMYTEIQSVVKKLQKEGYVLKVELNIENPKTGYGKYKNLSFKVVVKDDQNLPEKMMNRMLSVEDCTLNNDYSAWKEYWNDDSFLTELFVKDVEAIDIPRGYEIRTHRNRRLSLKAEVLNENGNTYLDALFAKIMVRYVERLKKSLVKDGSDLNDLVKLSEQNLHKLFKGKEVKYTIYLEQHEYVMLS